MPSVLFLTNNLQIGGAQRSLVNLAIHLARAAEIHVATLRSGEDLNNIRHLLSANVRIHHLRQDNAVLEVAHSVTILAQQLETPVLCFWNVTAELRIHVAHILSNDMRFKIIDVSPGPQSLYNLSKLADARHHPACLQHYLGRINKYVQKYQTTEPSRLFPVLIGKVVTIPNGVPEYFASTCDSPAKQLSHWLHTHAIASCGRIVPEKLIIEQIHVLYELCKLLPTAHLSFIGPMNPNKHRRYLSEIAYTIHNLGLQRNIHFQSPVDDPRPLLSRHKAVLMLSRNQGCPNTSLEAFSVGLPVVANADGGTSEQVQHGFSGFLVDPYDPRQAAEYLAFLMNHPKQASLMGARGKENVLLNFSMQKMASAYANLFWDATPSQVSECN